MAIMMQEGGEGEGGGGRGGGEGEGVILLKLSISCKEWDQQSFNFCFKINWTNKSDMKEFFFTFIERSKRELL